MNVILVLQPEKKIQQEVKSEYQKKGKNLWYEQLKSFFSKFVVGDLIPWLLRPTSLVAAT